MNMWIALTAGVLCGVFSAFGIGGGTLLLIFMTSMAGLPQDLAQGINLLYFIPTSLCALYTHFKNGYIDRPTAKVTSVFGVCAACAAAFAATSIDTALLKKLFGLFLLIIGLNELFSKTDKKTDKQ